MDSRQRKKLGAGQPEGRAATIAAMTDVELVRAWRSGDRAAGEELFERHYASIARFFRNKVGEELADDLAQRTFLACVEGQERFRGEASFRTYLFSIAYRLVCRALRDRYRRPAPLDFDKLSVQALDASPSAVLARRDEERLLLEGLRRLPFNYQVALELVYWESLTATETAAALGIPLGTAKTWIRRGRQALTRSLRELATTEVLLESTLTNLDGWARELRGLLVAESGPPTVTRR